MTKLAYVAGISLALGAGLGWGLHGANSGDEAEGASPIGVVQAVRLPVQQGASATVDFGQLRAIIKAELAATLRTELAAALAAQNGNAPLQANASVIQAPASPELQTQRRAALQAIEVLASGSRWGEEERISFHQQLALLDPEQAEQALQQVARAIDSGGMQVLTEGSPL